MNKDLIAFLAPGPMPTTPHSHIEVAIICLQTRFVDSGESRTKLHVMLKLYNTLECLLYMDSIQQMSAFETPSSE